MIGSGVELPETLAEPADPPHVLYVGRLSAEKGIEELVIATEGVPRVIVGDGPLRHVVPDALGFVPPAELGHYYDRAAVVVCPPGARATASSPARQWHTAARRRLCGGRAARRRGGRADGPARASGDSGALRAAIERLLLDPTLRARLGTAARERASERFSWAAATEATLAAYRSALSPGQRPTRS